MKCVISTNDSLVKRIKKLTPVKHQFRNDKIANDYMDYFRFGIPHLYGCGTFSYLRLKSAFIFKTGLALGLGTSRFLNPFKQPRISSALIPLGHIPSSVFF